MSSIFVQLASYHDYELPRTIKDIIKKSSGKNKINFGVHLVYYEKDDIEIPNQENIKITSNLAPENIGVGNGRFLANKHYSGEDYYLQIDSHSRLDQDWDIELISCYEKYKNEGCNPVLSAYPASYKYENYQIEYQNMPEIAVAGFVADQSFLHGYDLHQIALKNEDGNIFTKTISAGFLFSDGSISSIQPNRKIFFWGEESLTAIRLFTHGYDLMLPEKQVVYHLYYDHSDAVKNMRRQVAEDFYELYNKLSERSWQEISRIIENNVVGENELGSARTLKEYEAYSGVDFLNKTFTDDRFIV